MAATVTDLIRKYSDGSNYPNVASVSSPRSPGNTTLVCDDLTGWPTDTGVDFITFRLDTNNEVVSGSQTTWIAVKSGNSLINLTYVKGAVDTGNAINDRVMIVPSSDHADDLATAVLVHSNQDGTLKTSAVQAALNIASTPADYTPLATQPTTITYNGNRSYTAVFPDVNYTDRLSPRQRLRTTRTVAAPTQSALFDGTNQYFSKTSPAGMTFTDDFAAGAWIKFNAYPSSAAGIITRWNGTSGWLLIILADGRVRLEGTNAAGANFRNINSYQSVPLNKWVHVSAQLDMSAHTATSTTSYVMLDGVDVPAVVGQGGTNPTALVQAGNLEIGSYNGGTNPLNGKIVQPFVASAKITQANVRTLISQGLTPALISANAIVSAYSFDGVATDLNTTNANNLTAQNGATATNADSPFGGQADGTISSTVDYAEVVSVSYSAPNTTVTVRASNVNTIPTSGGISATSYSSASSPYGCPAFSKKLGQSDIRSAFTTASTTAVQVNGLSAQVVIPNGATEVRITAYGGAVYNSSSSGRVLLTIWDGTVGSGTQLAEAWALGTATPSAGGTTAIAVISPTAGSKTYNVGIEAESAGTATIDGGSGRPASIVVEVV